MISQNLFKVIQMLFRTIKTLSIIFLGVILFNACGQNDSGKAPEEIKKKVDSLDNEVMEELRESEKDSSDQ